MATSLVVPHSSGRSRKAPSSQIPASQFVHRPELIVLDDLSSALDVETEVELWTNLAAAGATVLAVSHREVAFERADQIIELAAGRRV